MTNPLRNEYQPDDITPPGESLAETLQFIGMSQSELARRIGRPVKTINEIINGKTAITPETALQLERALGVSNRFWRNRESDYRAYLARRAEDDAFHKLAYWIKRFPVAQMVRYGWLPATQTVEGTARALLAYFGVTSNQQYEDIYRSTRVAFRRSAKIKSNPDAIAAWFRKGSIDAQTVDCAPYIASTFRAALDDVRALTVLSAENFQPTLRTICARSGVAVVFVRELAGAPVNGATAWISPKKAMIALSLRHKTNDIFWFSFFHEAAHILKHSRRDTFVDSADDGSGSIAAEQEADAFASDFLIPQRALDRFLEARDLSATAIERFAKAIGIAPGIVVGRLQHDGLLKYSQLNGLKVRFEWKEIE